MAGRVVVCEDVLDIVSSSAFVLLQDTSSRVLVNMLEELVCQGGLMREGAGQIRTLPRLYRARNLSFGRAKSA